ncbi:thioredoxin domain-containing protein [bacterium]|nr:thioredoxin domain-containing protein [bacterium]
MPNKKSTKDTTSEKKEKTEKAAKAETKKVAAKVDVVEQAKKELAKLEAEQKNKTATEKFPWGVFCGGVILTLAVMLIGGKIMDMLTANRLAAKLPSIVKPLGGDMELDSISQPKVAGKVYSFDIKFADYDESFTSYITGDSKWFFTTGYDVAELLEQIAAESDGSSKQTYTCETLSKTDNPTLDIYVSSDCHYCRDAEVEFASAVQQVPALGDHMRLHYAGRLDADGAVVSWLSSTPNEYATENIRQACIQSEQHDSFWTYIGCMGAGGESETCLSQAGVNRANLNACMNDDSRGKALVAADIAMTESLAITGTPSFFVNNTEAVSDIDFGGRVPESYKQIVCCASSQQADFCSQTLK